MLSDLDTRFALLELNAQAKLDSTVSIQQSWEQ